ncbi:hypothetical protein AVEN_268950-1 [Araneus ventricosus]|uniref:BHLH domain-containing protein n=1 Tax=Araneus ventricosus TaxID=182803 RepID=A0A4Y2UWS9_ARAVE|nr:hypothetical protein AVEN_268950-1 [Araneus ventricosus]
MYIFFSLSSSAVRLQRNQAEKQRRDRLNGYISELATLVPMVKNSTKPVDKVSVLRLAAAHMRLNISCLNPARFKSKLSVLPSSVASYLEILEKNIGGFIVATTFAGVVVFCSKSVEDFLGYQNCAAGPIHGGSSVESGFELGTLQPQSRDLTSRPPRPMLKCKFHSNCQTVAFMLT